MYRAVVCAPHDDGGNGIPEYRRKTAGKLWILSEKRAAVHSDITDFDKYPGNFRSTGGATLILCVYLYCVPISLQNLFEACAGIIEFLFDAGLYF